MCNRDYTNVCPTETVCYPKIVYTLDDQLIVHPCLNHSLIVTSLLRQAPPVGL